MTDRQGQRQRETATRQTERQIDRNTETGKQTEAKHIGYSAVCIGMEE